ncbi:condensation domain-containing protein [Saccharothrix yanglingensis]|uniref:Condensation domain-containing protein n=1 Tax=Saccharothrix yanglingensis TaxID=659496 RepID=A0ABU0WUH1_9PSEU|nr:condensation domain-containing protein [Saccharothrix yanglingensis]MDQ2583495.1 hypothetical protein [Saccharothrix yanglingensis]
MSPRTEPASTCERRFWFAEQIGAGTRSVLLHIEIDGLVDEVALAEALRAVRARHEALRTGFALRGTALVREVHADPGGPELVLLPPDVGLADVSRVLTAVPLDLAGGSLIRAGVRGGDLFVVVHHIVFDGLSGQVFTKDLAAAYRQALDTGRADLGVSGRRPEPVIAAPRRAVLERHWRARLDGVPELPDLGASTTLRELTRGTVVEHEWSRPAGEAGRLRAYAREAGISVFTLALWAFASALGEVGGADDFCVGTVFADRPPGADHEIGCMINMLPIRIVGAGRDGGLARAWEAAVDALTHSELPIEDIVAACAPGNRRRMPLYQATLLYQSWPRVDHDAGPARLRSRPVSPRGGYAEVLLEVRDDERWHGVFQAPERAGWASRLDALSTAFSDRLDGLGRP